MNFLRPDKNKTFKPLKGHKKGSKRSELHNVARDTLGSGDMRTAVALPEGEDKNEWLAVHTVDFYNEISLLFGTVADLVTPEKFPTMSAGDKYEYLWADGESVKKPKRVPAREYVDLLLTWIEGQINNEEIFPTSTDVAFPKNFQSVISKMFTRMFRVYAFLYYHMYEEFRNLGADTHLNTCFKHFIFFVLEFELVDKKELEPLQELIDNMLERSGYGPCKSNSASGAASSS
eukprot:gb/GECG01000723.1/.p1 GENE.gb/GECG01000723.1/~~gb/GECG01000723.1/.p1  ORF type:complete len:232 (+),score=25.97 gb/GECG01000723.1/:1-696(+)